MNLELVRTGNVWGDGGAPGFDITLDASGFNPIYGKSDTVQPPAIKVMYYIQAEKFIQKGSSSGGNGECIKYTAGEGIKIENDTISWKYTLGNRIRI